MRHKSVIELSSSESPFTVLRSHPCILVYNFLNRVFRIYSQFSVSVLFIHWPDSEAEKAFRHCVS